MLLSNGKLAVFENFVVDMRLPKHSANRVAQVHMDGNSGFVMIPNRDRRKQSWLGKLWRAFLSLFTVDSPTMTVGEFFSSVNNSAKELEVVRERAAGYELSLLRAAQAGQQALLEQLRHGLNAHKMEAQLVAIGHAKYLEEKDLARFYKQAKRGMRLDWIKNFTRNIPADILARKARMDEIGIFDNYAVLHYDPEAKSFAETEEDRKDPILFGLMEGRRRLYFVGDWKDELCDLTMDDIADILGKESVKNLAETAE